MRALDHGCKSRWFHLGHSWAHCFTVNFLNYTSHSVSIISVYPLCVCEQVHLLASKTTSRQKKQKPHSLYLFSYEYDNPNPEWLSSLPLTHLWNKSAATTGRSRPICLRLRSFNFMENFQMKQEISEGRRAKARKKKKNIKTPQAKKEHIDLDIQ